MHDDFTNKNLCKIDVSGDDGKSWVTAQLHQPAVEGDNCRVWGWCLWSAVVATKRNVRIVSRAGTVLYMKMIFIVLRIQKKKLLLYSGLFRKCSTGISCLELQRCHEQFLENRRL
jgi:hypothetical protein